MFNKTLEQPSALFSAPGLLKVVGGKPPRTTITTLLENAFDKVIKILQPALSIEIGAFEADFF